VQWFPCPGVEFFEDSRSVYSVDVESFGPDDLFNLSDVYVIKCITL
jgi:hypothetical protein